MIYNNRELIDCDTGEVLAKNIEPAKVIISCMSIVDLPCLERHVIWEEISLSYNLESLVPYLLKADAVYICNVCIDRKIQKLIDSFGLENLFCTNQAI